MTYDEFKARLRQANLTVIRLAALLDMKPNSITNYRAKGQVPRHLAVIATLMAELASREVDIEALLAKRAAPVRRDQA